MTRPPQAYLHATDALPVVVVPAKAAEWLDRMLAPYRIDTRDLDPDTYSVVVALHSAAMYFRSSGSAEAEPRQHTPQRAASGWMTTTQAGAALGITDRAVRLAITNRRLSAERRAGRWLVSATSVATYRKSDS